MLYLILVVSHLKVVRRRGEVGILILPDEGRVLKLLIFLRGESTACGECIPRVLLVMASLGGLAATRSEEGGALLSCSGCLRRVFGRPKECHTSA